MNLNKRIIILLITMLYAISLYAKRRPGSFIIKKLTSHVYIAHPSLVKRVNSTSTIIVGDTYITVIESQTDVYMAKLLIEKIRREISKLPIKYLVFSHFHLDHILGASAFLEENPSLIIIAHQKTDEHIYLHGIDEQKSWGEIIKQKSIEAKLSAASAKSGKQKNYFLEVKDELEAYYIDIKSSQIIRPNVIFSDSFDLYDNELHLQLRFLGAAHTPGDITTLILPDKVLVTGDIVHDFEPLFWNADPDSWIGVLEKMKKIDFDYFIGGHGDLHKGKNMVDLWQNYIKELKAKTLTAIKEGLTLEKFQNRVTIDSFRSLQKGYSLRIQKFRSSYMDYLIGTLLQAVTGEIADLWKFYYGR